MLAGHVRRWLLYGQNIRGKLCCQWMVKEDAMCQRYWGRMILVRTGLWVRSCPICCSFSCIWHCRTVICPMIWRSLEIGKKVIQKMLMLWTFWTWNGRHQWIRKPKKVDQCLSQGQKVNLIDTGFDHAIPLHELLNLLILKMRHASHAPSTFKSYPWLVKGSRIIGLFPKCLK